MIVKLKDYVPNDGIFPIYYNGLKAVISHDVNEDLYVIVVVEIGKHLADNYVIPAIIDTDLNDYTIYPRRAGNVRGEWKELIKLKQ